MLFSILIDFSASYASQSKERLIGETSIGPRVFSRMHLWKGEYQFPASTSSSGVLGQGYTWALSEFGAGASTGVWAAPGGLDQLCSTQSRNQRKSLSVPGGLGNAEHRKPAHNKGSWIAHGPSMWDTNKYSSLVSAQLGRALFCFLKECCQFLFGWWIFALFKKVGKKKRKKRKGDDCWFFSPT